MNDECQADMEAAFPPETYAPLVAAMKRAVLKANEHSKSAEFMRMPVGLDARGYVRRAAIHAEIVEACEAGELPFVARQIRMDKGFLHHTEIESGAFIAHPVRTESSFRFPEDSLSRQDARLTNELDLFGDVVVPFKVLLGEVDKRYTWLTYGFAPDGSFTHICWAMPSPPGVEEWLAHIDVLGRLKDLGAGVEDVQEAVPEPPPKPSLRFKENIEAALSKDKGDLGKS